MEIEETKQLLLKLLALADRMEQRDAQVIAQLAQQVSSLEHAAHAVGAGGRDFASEALDVLRRQGREAVQAGVAEAVSRVGEALTQSAAEAGRSSQALRDSAAELRQQRNLWLWAAPLALIVGSILSTGAAMYAVVDSRAQIGRNRIEAKLLRAYNAADVTLCGERLCANVDDAGVRHGEHQQYRPVNLR